MLEKANKKVIQAILFVFIIICVVSLYFYLTHPVGIADISSISPINKISVNLTLTGTNSYGLPSRLNLAFDNEQDINAIMSILNKYKYSKELKLYVPGIVPAKSNDGAIDIFIFYTDKDNKAVDQYIFVDTENHVTIRNKRGTNIDYKLEEGHDGLFQDLSSWISEKD